MIRCINKGVWEVLLNYGIGELLLLNVNMLLFWADVQEEDQFLWILKCLFSRARIDVAQNVVS